MALWRPTMGARSDGPRRSKLYVLPVTPVFDADGAAELGFPLFREAVKLGGVRVYESSIDRLCHATTPPSNQVVWHSLR